MKRLVGLLAILFLIAVLCAVFIPARAQTIVNAVTRAMLQSGTWTLSGVYKLTGATFLPSGITLPATCDASVSGARRFFHLSSDNTFYMCTATNTWTSVGGIPNPFTANQEFSGTVTASGTFNGTGTVILPRQQTVEVCKAGCQYTTVQAAVDAITDASATKRYIVLIHPGDYFEQVTMKSDITLQGVNKNTTRILGSTAGGVQAGISIPVGANRTAYRGLSIGDSNALSYNVDDSASPTEILVDDCIIGVFGVSGTDDSIDCFFENTSGKGHKVTAMNVTLNYSADCIMVGAGSTFIGRNLTVNNKSAMGSGQFVRPVAGGATIIIDGLTNRGTIASGTSSFYVWTIPGATSTTGTYLDFRNVVWDITTTSTSGTTFRCMNFGSIPAQTNGSVVNIENFSCRLTSADASQTLRGIEISNDADYSNWLFNWRGGDITFSGPAGTQTDVVNNSTVTGLFNISGVRHSGTYTGAGAVNALETRQASFAAKLVGPSGDLAVGTCGAGEWKLDTGGATKEMCLCDPANTWNCAALTAGGPAD